MISFMTLMFLNRFEGPTKLKIWNIQSMLKCKSLRNLVVRFEYLFLPSSKWNFYTNLNCRNPCLFPFNELFILLLNVFSNCKKIWTLQNNGINVLSPKEKKHIDLTRIKSSKILGGLMGNFFSLLIKIMYFNITY